MAAIISDPLAGADEVHAIRLPAGEGAAVVARKCSVCHTLDKVVKQRRTKAEWTALLKFMVVQGLDISAEEQRSVLRYLTVNFGRAVGDRDDQGADGARRAERP